jgi:hypothetical protein
LASDLGARERPAEHHPMHADRGRVVNGERARRRPARRRWAGASDGRGERN